MAGSDTSTVRSLDGAAPVSVAEMVESVVGCKWSVHLLALVAEGTHRPSALLRASPGLSAKVMNERLRKMLRFGILEKVVHGEKPPLEVEYRLTPFGQRFRRILEEVRKLQADVDRGLLAERRVPTERSLATGRAHRTRKRTTPGAC